MSVMVTVLLVSVAIVAVSVRTDYSGCTLPHVLVQAFDLSAIKPIAFDAQCGAREPCAIHVAEMEHIPTLGFCNCPGDNVCPNDEQHTHVTNGIRYQVRVPSCKNALLRLTL